MIATFDEFATSLGIAFVPVSAGTKRAYHEDWTNRLFTAPDFKADGLVGGKWGAPSRDLCDVDCDTVYASRICRDVLTTGPRYGRPGNPHSHFLVRAPGAKTKKWIDPITKGMIIELGADGSLSILPPSRHTSGELYVWERRGTVAAYEPQSLLHGLGEIAAAAFLASLWKEKSRHEFALHLSGFLATNRIALERAERFMRFVTTGADDDEARDRLSALTTTYERHANGEDVIASFTGLVSEDQRTTVLQTLMRWLGLERQRFKIENEDALLNCPAAPFLVKSSLVRGSLVVLFSPPNLGKTFLALDLMLNLCAKQPSWLGQPVRHHGPVLYVIGEGVGRFKLRVIAWKQSHRLTHSLPFYWIGEPVPLLDDKAVAGFLKQAASLRPIGVVFDTMSRCLMGGDENSQQDVGKAIASCDEIRARTSAMTLLLHHTVKDGGSERGSSVLRGAADTMLSLVADAQNPELLKLCCEKQKDADAFDPIELVRYKMQLDGVVDEEGDPETSCVIRLASDRDMEAFATMGDDRRRHKILEYVANNPGCTKNQVLNGIGGRRADGYAVLDDLLQEKKIVDKGSKGKGATSHLFTCEGSLF